MLFRSWKFDFIQVLVSFLFLWGYSLGCLCATKEVFFLYSETAFVLVEVKVGFSETLEDHSRVFDHLSGDVGRYNNIIKLLCTLVLSDG